MKDVKLSKEIKARDLRGRMKVKRVPRLREWLTEGQVSFTFEVGTTARTEKEAAKIAHEVLNGLDAPKRLRVKIGKRRKLLKNYKDYSVDLYDFNIENERTDYDDY